MGKVAGSGHQFSCALAGSLGMCVLVLGVVQDFVLVEKLCRKASRC